MSVKLINTTPDLENTISYCARVSSPKNQENYNTAPKLLKYCIKNAHWSIFEMGHMTVEITTTLPIATQILRHKSFSFQQHSGRYTESEFFDHVHPRRQDVKNRQNSIDDLPQDVIDWFYAAQREVVLLANQKYQEALKKGIAKESARFLLPSLTQTRMYMSGSIRSWIHYCLVRCEKSTQLEHREIANECYRLLKQRVPNVCEALEDIHPWLKEIE